MCPRFPLLPSEPGGEPASAAPGGGRSSLSFALSRLSINMLRWQDANLQDLRPALCLPQRPAEGECRLQAWDGPLDSGRHHPGLSGTGCALPVQVESSLYKKYGVLLGAGSWHSLTDICRAAGWASPNTFARFYSLHVEPVSGKKHWRVPVSGRLAKNCSRESVL